MSTFTTHILNGTAQLDGLAPFEFSKCHLTSSSLLIRNYSIDDLISETGPHFSLHCVNTRVLQDAIFSYLCYDYVLPCQFKFQGPVLGYVRSYAGYMAASDGGDQRPLENVNLYINLDPEEGLTVKINGIAGHIIEIDCSSKDQQFIKKLSKFLFK